MRIHYSNTYELAMILIQLASYVNQWIVQLFILGFPSIIFIIWFIVSNVLSITAHIKANRTHQTAEDSE